MKKTLFAVAVLLFSFGFAQLAKADDIQTVGEYTGTGPYSDPGPYQPSTVIGTFTILPGDTGITISGTFGNSTIPSSAGVNVFLGSIEVASCVENAACYTGASGSPTPWSDTLTATQIASLGTGLVNFSVTQTSQYVIQLGVTTLDQSLGTVATPEPSSALLLGCGILGLIGISRRKLLAGIAS